jgi:small subunit ribosomal protein S6
MNLYEHTIIARQDMGSKQLEQITEKYTKIIEKNNGKIVKTENWGLLNYIHFKIEGPNNTVKELEKNEKLDKNLLRYATIKVRKFDLETTYFKNETKDIEKKSE